MVRKARLETAPAWPVIALRFEGDIAVADAAGVGEPIRVAAYPDLATAAGAAAAAAARRLNVPRCRVQGVNPDGEDWMMIVDAATETLEELVDNGSESQTRKGAGLSRGPLSLIPRRWWLVIGVSVIAAVAIAATVVPRSMLPGPLSGGLVAVDETPVPDPGQLPVSSPTGWDTYARWVLPVAKPEAAAVLAGAETLVLVDGADVIAVDVKTGRELWRSRTAGNVTALYSPKDSDVIYAARSNTGVSILDRSTGKVLSDGQTSARNIGLGDVPFAELPGQAGAVLVGRSWERRQVPATAVPLGTVGDGLVSVSVEQSRLWVTTSDSPILPDAVTLEAPAEGLSLARAIAFVDSRLVLAWADRRGLQMYSIDVVNEAGNLTSRITFDAPSPSSGKVTVDANAGLVGIGSLLLDLNTGSSTEAEQGTVTVSAGFGWTGQGRDRVRISRDGAMVPLRSDAVIPDVVLPDGRAVVRAAHGAAGNAYYVLEVLQPKPAATPKPSPTDGKEQ